MNRCAVYFSCFASVGKEPSSGGARRWNLLYSIGLGPVTGGTGERRRRGFLKPAEAFEAHCPGEDASCQNMGGVSLPSSLSVSGDSGKTVARRFSGNPIIRTTTFRFQERPGLFDPEGAWSRPEVNGQARDPSKPRAITLPVAQALRITT